MTLEEAIKTIKLAQAQIEWDCPMDYAVAFDMAIEALEKQIPKKAELYDEDLICPVCGADVEWKRYCEECGQRIGTGDES